MSPILFRDLPVVIEIETLLALHARGLLADEEAEELPHQIDDASRDLFGITRNDTLYPALPEAVRARYGRAEWEAQFDILGDYSRDPNAPWRGFGIDLSCPEGCSLHCLDMFGRQLICALGGLHPLAVFSFVEHGIPQAA
jgi:hypothetical protein